MEKELQKAEELKGSKLSKNEKFLVEQFWNNLEFELRKYDNGSIGYHKRDFMEWFRELVEQANKIDWPINTEDPESYRDYFDNGYDVDEAITEDIQSCD